MTEQKIDLALNGDSTVTLYVAGRKVQRGSLDEIVAVLRGRVDEAPQRTRRERPKSRTQRWEDAASAAETALQDLVDLQQEYQDWYDNLPENLQGSALGEKLSAMADYDLQSALDAVQEASGADLPQGFGRD